jgi:hypothetical protein
MFVKKEGACFLLSFFYYPRRMPQAVLAVFIKCVVYLNSPCCVYSFEHLPVCHVPRKLDSINDRRVVHAQDVQTRRVHVSGRENHFVCGVSACQDFVTQIFTLSLLQRWSFSMYPEEIRGMEINSASMMWEQIDEIFHKIRLCMSAGRQGTTSATFTMPLLCTVFDFWQVPLYDCYVCVS